MEMKRVGDWIVLGVLVFVLFIGTASASANVLIGVVNSELVIEQSDAGHLANADLAIVVRSWQDLLGAKEQDIEALMQDIETNSDQLSAEDMVGKQQELNELIQEYASLEAEAEHEIQTQALELRNLILQDIAHITGIIGRREGYTLITDASMVFYHGPQIDITAEVIREYNKLLATEQANR